MFNALASDVKAESGNSSGTRPSSIELCICFRVGELEASH